MEYIRKRRWANYSNAKCKEYLRNDFSHECAYCKLQEKEVGVVGVDYFEIDHFKPQSLNFPEMHNYDNLYYCCEKCNKEKSDIWDIKLLDPCKDDIFGGDNPAIKGGTSKEKFKYIAQNDKGTFYINTFKLNSRTQMRFRKMRANHKNIIYQMDLLIDEILMKFKDKNLPDLEPLMLQLDNLRDKKQQELNKLPRDEVFETAELYLNDKKIENYLVFEEYNMDIKIKINNNTYYCELLVDNSIEEKDEYRKKLSIEKMNVWFENIKNNFGILFYYPNINRMYFYPISEKISSSDLSDYNKYKQIKISAKDLI